MINNYLSSGRIVWEERIHHFQRHLPLLVYFAWWAITSYIVLKNNLGLSDLPSSEVAPQILENGYFSFGYESIYHIGDLNSGKHITSYYFTGKK